MWTHTIQGVWLWFKKNSCVYINIYKSNNDQQHTVSINKCSVGCKEIQIVQRNKYWMGKVLDYFIYMTWVVMHSICMYTCLDTVLYVLYFKYFKSCMLTSMFASLQSSWLCRCIAKFRVALSPAAVDQWNCSVGLYYRSKTPQGVTQLWTEFRENLQKKTDAHFRPLLLCD